MLHIMASPFLRLFCGAMLTFLFVCGEYYVAKESQSSVKYKSLPASDNVNYYMTQQPLARSSSGNTTPIRKCLNCTAPSQCLLALIPTCIAPTTCGNGSCSTTKTSTETSTKVLTTTSIDVAMSTNTITETTTQPVAHTSTVHTTSTSTKTATDTTTATETKTETHTTTDTTTATVNSTHTTTSTSTLTKTHTGTKTSTLVIPTTMTHHTTETLTSTSTGVVNKTLLTTATEIATSTSTHTTTEIKTQTETETLKTTATHLTTDTITATSTHVTTATSTDVQTETKTDSITDTKTETTTETHHTTATETHSKTLLETQTSTEIATSVVTSCSDNCPITTIVPTTTVHTTKVVISTVHPPTTLPPTEPAEPPCKEALDIGVVLDASDSVTPEDFQVCLRFVSNLTDQFQVSPTGTHFGAIVYSSNPELKFSFGDSQYYRPRALKAKILTFQRIATGTRTDLALEMAGNELFSVAGGDRDLKPNILIVITDGETNRERSTPYPEVLEPLKNKQVKIIAVGVGAGVGEDRKSPELVEIAMKKQANVFKVDDYANLLENLKEILKSSCVEATTTPAPTAAPSTQTSNRPDTIPTTTVHTTKVVISTVPSPTTLPPTEPAEPPCKVALDIGVVLDASDSVNPEDFQVCLGFVSNLTDQFQVSPTGTHFGAIVYSSNPELKFSFGDSQYYSPSALKPKILTFQRIATGTRTDLALEMAGNDLFSFAGGDRDSKPNILIVITDGRTDPDRSTPYPEVLEPLKNKQVKVIAVGVGKDVLRRELVEIAMEKQENVFMVDDYANLLENLKEILKSSCVEATTTPAPTAAPSTQTPNRPDTSHCQVKYTKVGCFKDKAKQKARALPQLISNERDSISWQNWDTWLPQFICRCAEKTKENNFFYFGAQFYGECWSGPDGGETYNVYGSSDTCMDKTGGSCTAASVGECVGKNKTNYVYQIVIEANPEEVTITPSPTPPEDEMCNVDSHKIGCYKDDMINPRPLQELLFTDRDKKSKLYSGISIDWGNWDSYISDIVCRCAKTAHGKEYNTFGIENFGECWSGLNANNTYNRAGQTNLCMTTEYALCDSKDNEDCVGNATTVFVYGITEDEETVPCDVKFENVGCYKDNNTGSDPLPELLFTDVDTNATEYSGQSVLWGQLDRYLSDVACRCAENAAEMEYEYFGIQNFGQCYSGKSASQTYKNDGVSGQCVHKNYEPCPPNAVEETCVGKEKVNYVYRIIEAPNSNEKSEQYRRKLTRVHRKKGH